MIVRLKQDVQELYHILALKDEESKSFKAALNARSDEVESLREWKRVAESRLSFLENMFTKHVGNLEEAKH